ncbi:MAG: acyltransferase [Actinomycetota bacterium]
MTDAKDHLRENFDDIPPPANVKAGHDCLLEFNRYSFQKFFSKQPVGLLLGDRVSVHMWTAFGTGPSGRITVGDDCLLVGAQFMCEEEILIGERVIISYNVTIADSDFHPLDPDLRRQDAIAISPEGDREQRPPFSSAPVVIEDDVTVGIGAMILKGVRIGSRARIGAGSVVTRDVPSDATVFGNPAVIEVPPAI